MNIFLLGSRTFLIPGVAAAALLGLSPRAQAQSAGSGWSRTVDLAFGAASSRQTGALSANLFRGFGNSRRFKLGLGLRVASFRGRGALAYDTADAGLITDKRVNTLRVPDPRTYSANLAFHAHYGLTDRLDAGFNIDVIGVGFGAKRTGIYAATKASFAGPQSARASTFDNLRGGNPDRGQLDSEFFLSWWLTKRWAVRAGFSHFFSEYTTAIPLDDGNDRYRHKANLGMLAVSFRP